MMHKIITSEKVPFTFQVAGLGSRFLATMIDTAFFLLLAIMGLLLSLPFDLARPGVGTAFFMVWLFVLMCGYFVLCEWLWFGQTPGKKILGIRVIQWEGMNITFGQSALRNLIRMIDLFPGFYGLAGIVALANRENRRLGDLAAGTLVVHVQEKNRLLLPTPVPVTQEEKKRRELLRTYVAKMSRDQKQTLLELTARRDQLRIRARAKLVKTTTDYFREVYNLPPLEYESDDKLISNLASLIQLQDRKIG